MVLQNSIDERGKNTFKDGTLIRLLQKERYDEPEEEEESWNELWKKEERQYAGVDQCSLKEALLQLLWGGVEMRVGQ